MTFFLSISSPPLSFSLDFSKYSSITVLVYFNPAGPALPEHLLQILDLDIRQTKKQIEPLGLMSIRSLMVILTFPSMHDDALLIEL